MDNLVMEKVEFGGDNPQARFGHTITPISKDKALLFGGAVGDGGRYTITGDIFLGDFTHKKWHKLETKGSQPSNRAAHGAVSIGHYLFIYGGALGGGDLADSNLYQLEFQLNSDKAIWSIVETVPGASPGQRYGHIMAALKTSIIVHGGNTGSQAVGDLWKVDVFGDKVWEKIVTNQCPSPRVYHSASFCRSGTANSMLVVFGGRGADQSSLNDTWGLRRHRNGTIDWMQAPERPTNRPTARYQHRTLFIGTLLVIIGGRNNEVGESLPLDIFDTESSQWFKLPKIQRFRHACMLLDSELFIHGGFDQDKPNVPTGHVLKVDLHRLFFSHRSLMTGLAYELGIDAINHNVPRLHRSHDSEVRERHDDRVVQTSNASNRTNAMHRSDGRSSVKRLIQTPNRGIKLCNDILVVNFDEQQDMKKIKLNQLPTENKRLVSSHNFQDSRQNIEKIYKTFLNPLFCRNLAHISFPVNQEAVRILLDSVEKLIQQEQTLVKLRAPVKIFGDIHGQIADVNRFFDIFGSPSDDSLNGDVEFTNYLFLGDYVDRGAKSVETLLMLFSLKLKYPDQVVLLRGSHEDSQVCKSMGFADQCAAKFKEENVDDPSSFFSRCCRIFEKMPLAALIEGEILCVHGGIGHTVQSLDEIQSIQRPIKVNHDPRTKQDKIIYDLLWSDPCRNNEDDFAPNVDHDYFRTKMNIRFSDNRAIFFCNNNDLLTIVRSGEAVSEGYEARQSVVTIFSNTDYGGQNNKASIMFVTKSQQIRPLVINPIQNKQPRWLKLDQDPRAPGSKELRAQRFTPPRC